MKMKTKFMISTNVGKVKWKIIKHQHTEETIRSGPGELNDEKEYASGLIKELQLRARACYGVVLSITILIKL